MERLLSSKPQFLITESGRKDMSRINISVLLWPEMCRSSSCWCYHAMEGSSARFFPYLWGSSGIKINFSKTCSFVSLSWTAQNQTSKLPALEVKTANSAQNFSEIQALVVSSCTPKLVLYVQVWTPKLSCETSMCNIFLFLTYGNANTQLWMDVRNRFGKLLGRLG